MSKNNNIISCDKISTMSPQKLAFIGDAVYELMVRCKIVESYEGNIGSLNSVKIKNVCCSAQSELYEKIKKLKKGVDFHRTITYNTTCLEERTKQKTKDK